MDEEDFLQAILSNPHEDAALLSYSDWLEEQGDPGSAAKHVQQGHCIALDLGVPERLLGCSRAAGRRPPV